MFWLIVGLLVCIGVPLLWITTRINRYKSLFAPAHFVELAQALQKVKAAALMQISTEGEERPPLSDDARVLRTTPDLALLYTVALRGEEYVHHYSISLAGRYTPSAVGETFTLYVAQRMGVDLHKVTLRVSEANVFHTEFVLTPTEQEAFAQHKIDVPDAERAKTLYQECLMLREQVTFTRMDTGIPR